MSETLVRVHALAERGELVVSRHGFREIAADDIVFADIVTGMRDAALVEDYPDAERGPSVLVLQRDRNGQPLHILWGIARDQEGPAVLITAYRPDANRWSLDFRRRVRQ